MTESTDEVSSLTGLAAATGRRRSTAAACGGGSIRRPLRRRRPTTDPTPPRHRRRPTDSATITIGADGRVSPATVTIRRGGRVTFVNNHTRAHDMSSDPHPEHTQCPEINQIGLPDRRPVAHDSGNLNTARTCGFHDHNLPDNAGLQGSIVIQ